MKSRSKKIYLSNNELLLTIQALSALISAKNSIIIRYPAILNVEDFVADQNVLYELSEKLSKMAESRAEEIKELKSADD